MTAKPYLNGTDLIHADDILSNGIDVTPAISLTTSELLDVPQFCVDLSLLTAFRAPGPESLDPFDPSSRIYSRYTTDVTSRVELLLGKIIVSYLEPDYGRRFAKYQPSLT